MGSRIRLDIEELGVHGWARVTAVEACPEVASGPGRVVMATFTHVTETVRRVELAVVEEGGLPGGAAVEVLEPTAGHPLFSLTRGDWVKAGELRSGERLQTRSGVAQVLSVETSPGALRVFNFEVEGEHEYLVGGLEVRSHNACAPDAPKTKSPNQLGKEGEAKVKASTGLDQNHEVFDVEGRGRKPDFVEERGADNKPTKVHEVKNVKKQHLSSQLKDYAKLVGPDGEVKVHLRGPEGSPDATKITPQLKEKFDDSNSPLKPVWDL